MVVLLVWLWLSNLALLFGAELNAEIERGRELVARLPGAERTIQLPLRDTTKLRHQQKDEHKPDHPTAIGAA